jgi:ABC-type Fe3+ transport system permease subunit
MQRLWRFLAILPAAVPLAAQAQTVAVSVGGNGGFWIALLLWLGFPPPPPPEVSPHHLSASSVAPRSADPCTWVAGVRHCPLAHAQPR